MALDKAEIWVKVHNLPFGFMSKKIRNLMGNHISRLVKYDFENSCASGGDSCTLELRSMFMKH